MSKKLKPVEYRKCIRVLRAAGWEIAGERAQKKGVTITLPKANRPVSIEGLKRMSKASGIEVENFG